MFDWNFAAPLLGSVTFFMLCIAALTYRMTAHHRYDAPDADDQARPRVNHQNMLDDQARPGVDPQNMLSDFQANCLGKNQPLPASWVGEIDAFCRNFLPAEHRKADIEPISFQTLRGLLSDRSDESKENWDRLIIYQVGRVLKILTIDASMIHPRDRGQSTGSSVYLLCPMSKTEIAPTNTMRLIDFLTHPDVQTHLDDDIKALITQLGEHHALQALPLQGHLTGEIVLTDEIVFSVPAPAPAPAAL